MGTRSYVGSMTRITTAFLLTVAAAVGIGTAAATVAAGTQAGSTQIARADFAHPQANPWFPLRPGTTTVLRGTDEGERLRERVHVTGQTKTIQGIRARVVSDVLRRSIGRLAERTTDWYAADNAGNVWYFGEAT